MLKGADEPPANWFGTLTQGVDAAAYRNRRVRYRAAVRVEGPPGTRAQLWLRVDRRTGGFSFFDHMSTRPITSSTWSQYTIDGYVLDDSAQVFFGVIIGGPGRVWVDAVTLETAGQVHVDPPEPSRLLSDAGLTNLAAFAKVYGYARFFNPSDQAATADWDTIAVEGARLAEEAGDARELAERIQWVFNLITPTLRVYPEGGRPELPPELRPGSPNPEAPFRTGCATLPLYGRFASSRFLCWQRPAPATAHSSGPPTPGF